MLGLGLSSLYKCIIVIQWGQLMIDEKKHLWLLWSLSADSRLPMRWFLGFLSPLDADSNGIVYDWWIRKLCLLGADFSLPKH